MKLSLNWLKEIVPQLKNFSDDKIIDAFERLGYEVEEIIRVGDKLKNIYVVKILQVRKHPNADKLSICDITDGKENYSVVCGASNVYEGMHSAFIKAFDKLPDGRVIESKEIRGVLSNGMLCSSKELMLDNDHQGIMDLPKEFKLGDQLDKYFSDVIIDISTPANRYDCLGHIGIARELAVMFMLPFSLPKPVEEVKDFPFVDVKVDNREICPRYIACRITSLKNNVDLPFFIKQRIISCGLRLVNSLVDISNYVLLEIGHPVHIFDFDKIEGSKIIVRRANLGEKILALDNKEYDLDEEIIVISDMNKPIAIAGIIGGENSKVDEKTKNIVIESALFNKSFIRLGRKKLSISTDASYRFERGSSWNMCEYALFRTKNLVQQYCGGIVSHFVDVRDNEYHQQLSKTIKVNINFISNFLGMKVSEEDMTNIIRGLGGDFLITDKQIREQGEFVIVPPHHRQDWVFQADIAEEIARFKGYDNITATLPNVFIPQYQSSDYAKFKKKIFERLISEGYFQVINNSLCSNQENRLFIEDFIEPVKLANPVSKDYDEMRVSLITNLLKNIHSNLSYQYPSIKFFENGKIYYKSNGKTTEQEQVAMIITGEDKVLSWKKDVIPCDFYYINGTVENILKDLKISYNKTYFEFERISDEKISKYIKNSILTDCVGYYEKKSGQLISLTGKVNKSITKIKTSYDIFYAELYIENIFKYYDSSKIFTELPQFPFVSRDVSLIVNEDLKYDSIIETINEYLKRDSSNSKLIEVEVFDYFKREGKLTIALHIKILDRNKTLTDEEVNVIVNEILDQLKHLQIELRKD